MHSYDRNSVDEEQFYDSLRSFKVEQDPDDAREDELSREGLKDGK